MIVLDTHIWVWWVQDSERLSRLQAETILENEADVIGISAKSCWEVAKLVEKGRLELSVPMDQWFDQALGYPAVQLLALTPDIAIESTRLGDDFNRDPADQLIAATARIYGCSLVTSDKQIIDYPRVETIY